MIDEGLPGHWPPEVVAAVSQFQQGDLVPAPPFAYTGTARHGIWSLTRDFGDSDTDDELFEVDADYRPPFGMIATDTCDLTEEERRYRQHPWFSVAPVYEVDESVTPERLELVRQGRISFQRCIENKAVGPLPFIVDARILVPVEKSWLVGKVPIRIYSTPEERMAVAQFFAARFSRPDLSPTLYEVLIKPLRRWLERLSSSRRDTVLSGVREIRLAVAGDPLNPDGAALIILVEDKSAIETIRGDWDRKWESWRARGEEVGIALLSIAYETVDSLSARQYCESIGVDISFN